MFIFRQKKKIVLLSSRLIVYGKNDPNVLDLVGVNNMLRKGSWVNVLKAKVYPGFLRN